MTTNNLSPLWKKNSISKRKYENERENQNQIIYIDTHEKKYGGIKKQTPEKRVVDKGENILIHMINNN